ncbi:hypothetical protein [Phycisphaera mikurensis]|uniref:Sulfotransferase n=1 Tax=Phycisphaera mikurensis (strain NBRC 102666 / KCTC 22515 / FYK2301M01) TaxID=1142394 RepID=I0IE34_PHYMF|nr:hypothetical protein [Phycisphaera mikurensis]MBB6441327.1 hypothetical protein [Phycisphaera mikurensis]BAM03522.1 hypothetical protein PSMK_13630 [Phycisphaera mikurensis NBRC 102666]
MEPARLGGSTAAGATLYLHLGLPKTASTHLQREVFPRLTHVGVRSMPRTGLFTTPADAARDARLMAACFCRSVEVWAARGDEVFAELLGEATPPAEPRTRGLLVSDEAMGRTGSRPRQLGGHLAAMAERAAAWGFPRVRVLCVVRRQDHWLASHYAQGADRRPAASQADFEAMVAEALAPEGERYGFGMLLDYAVLHRALADAVGGDRVTMLPYEWLTREPQRFLGGVLAALDTPPADRERLLAEAPGGGRTNVKGAGGGAWTLSRRPVLPAAARRVLPRALAGRLEWRLRRRFEKQIVLRPDASERILTAYRASNEELARAIGVDLIALGYGPAG